MGIVPTNDEGWMRHAIRLAQRAEQQGEVPVGAVLVKDGRCISEGWNASVGLRDPSAHAEIMALRSAGQALDNYRLVNTTLYVTLEPCVMCMGALSQARVGRLVFGATDPKRGAVCSAIALADAGFLNHRITWQSGVLADECSALLVDFFRVRR